MLEYGLENYDKLAEAFFQHIWLVAIALALSLLIASALTAAAMHSRPLSACLVHLFAIIYSIPSLAMFAMLIPLTGLGRKTAILVLVMYNQYLMLRNFLAGLDSVDPALVEAAAGMGMTRMQILRKVRIPLSLKPLFAGIRIAAVSTIGIATIAASINAGGLGAVLFDGLRTMNMYKIIWGAILSALLAIGVNYALETVELGMDKGNPLPDPAAGAVEQ